MNDILLSPIRFSELEILIQNSVRKVMAEITDQATTTEENDIRTADQIAKLLSVSLPTVYGYVHFKQIPFMKRRGKLYFSRKEVEEWLKEGRRMTRAESIRASLDTLSR